MTRKKRLLQSTCLGALLGVAVGATTPGFAQPLDEIVVTTGSYIKRDNADSASPISVVDRATFEDLGIPNAVDYVKFLPINTGSEFNADIFSQGGTAGTAQYNLRGLGLGSTLVLVNGRRSVTSGVVANNRLSFIDINTLMPQVMIDRVEILKDGASTLYGTDAVAGVVNNITRDRFEGAELAFDYRNGRSDQRNLQGDAIFGWANDNTNIVAGFSYIDQTNLLASERDFATVTSSLGSPGSFFPLAPSGATIGAPRSDTLCGTVGGSPQSFPGGPGLCIFDLAPFTDLVTDDERLLGMVTIRHDLANSHELFADLNYSHRETLRTGAPSFPGLRPITVPLSHPRIGDAPSFGLPSPPLAALRFFGRPLGNGFDPVQSLFEDDYYRAVVGVRGDITDNWNYEAAVTYGVNNLFNSSRNDVLATELQTAINTGAFNPFGTALNGIAPNSSAVIDTFRANLDTDTHSELFVADAVVSGDLFDLPAGPVGLAVGGQFRYNERSVDPNLLANQNRFFFLIGTPDAEGDQTAYAVFGETIVPIADWLEVQAAVRYENYGGEIGSSVDPKVAVLVQPTDFLSLRGSYSTAFRAPQVGQTIGEGVSIVGVFDPVNPTGPGVVFTPVRTRGNPNLLPEEADTYNVGLTVEPFEGFSASVDYWRFEYDNLITSASAQGVVLANPFGAGIVRAGGVLQQVNVGLINAPSLETDGLDIGMEYNGAVPNSDVNFRVMANATHIMNYELQTVAGAPPVELAGSRNRTNIATATPRWRGDVSVIANKGSHTLSLTGRYIHHFTNDDPVAVGERISSWTIFDGQYSFDLPAFDELSNAQPRLSVGATNIFDRDPPIATTNRAFPIATKVHDPRGRVVYFRLGVSL